MFGDRLSPKITCAYSVSSTYALNVLFPTLTPFVLTYVDDNIVFGISRGDVKIEDLRNELPNVELAFERVHQGMDVMGL